MLADGIAQKGAAQVNNYNFYGDLKALAMDGGTGEETRPDFPASISAAFLPGAFSEAIFPCLMSSRKAMAGPVSLACSFTMADFVVDGVLARTVGS